MSITSLPHTDFLADAVTWSDLRQGLESGDKDSPRVSDKGQGSSRASDKDQGSSRASEAGQGSRPVSEADFVDNSSDRSGSEGPSDRAETDSGLRGEIVPCGGSEELARESPTGKEVSG